MVIGIGSTERRRRQAKNKLPQKNEQEREGGYDLLVCIVGLEPTTTDVQAWSQAGRVQWSFSTQRTKKCTTTSLKKMQGFGWVGRPSFSKEHASPS